MKNPCVTDVNEHMNKKNEYIIFHYVKDNVTVSSHILVINFNFLLKVRSASFQKIAIQICNENQTFL